MEQLSDEELMELRELVQEQHERSPTDWGYQGTVIAINELAAARGLIQVHDSAVGLEEERAGEHGPFTEAHCIKVDLGPEDFTDAVVVLDEGSLGESIRMPRRQLFYSQEQHDDVMTGVFLADDSTIHTLNTKRAIGILHPKHLPAWAEQPLATQRLSLRMKQNYAQCVREWEQMSPAQLIDRAEIIADTKMVMRNLNCHGNEYLLRFQNPLEVIREYLQPQASERGQVSDVVDWLTRSRYAEARYELDPDFVQSQENPSGDIQLL